MVSFSLSLLVVLMVAISTVAVRTSNRIVNKKYNWELDTQEMINKSSFKIKPAKLIDICKGVIDREIGLKNPDDLADDFIFQFPYIGPLSKSAYLSAVGGFQIKTAFPDYNPGIHDFRVDPFEPNRVWYTVAFTATHSGDGPLPFGKATGTKVEAPPQVNSLTFNEKGQVVKYTGGYPVDKTIGNTGGMGGVFGPLYAIGRPFPFPEANPWKKSWQFEAFTMIGNFIQSLTRK